jgi:hypothetical protein
MALSVPSIYQRATFAQRESTFRNLGRITLGLVTEVRTGHGYFREYHCRFNIPEPYDCPCGVELQSRTYILFECPLHDDARHLLYEAVPDGQISSLLVTEKGIKGLMPFLKASNAFPKLFNAPHTHTHTHTHMLTQDLLNLPSQDDDPGLHIPYSFPPLIEHLDT